MNIRKLDGGLLLVFRELLLRQRASDVARRLGLSQSAISHALARLRDVFGDPLFVRRSHGLEPTRRALELGPQVETLIQLIDAAVSLGERFDPAQTRRRFRIACPDWLASLIGDRLVNAFRTHAPGATFSTRPVILDRALEAVRRGELDLALGAFGAIPPEIETSLLFEEQYWVIARAGHPAVRGQVDRETYATIGHVFVGNPDGALSDETPWDRKAMDASYGLLPSPEQVRTHAYVSQWETAMLTVANSDALADCPRRLAERFAAPLGLQVIEPPHEPFRLKIQAARRTRSKDEAVDWLLAQVRAAVA